jgi:hypothetical protein
MDEVAGGSVPEWMSVSAFDADPDHLIVVYSPTDNGAELDAVEIFGVIAADAAQRATAGLRILSMTTVPLRHAGAWMGRDGSGFETKVAIGVVYERWAGVTPA